MAMQIIPEPSEPSVRPLDPIKIGESWRGDKVTNTEAMELVRELRSWAGQFHHPEAQKLSDGLRDVEKLFVRVWTEVDEALGMLSLSHAVSASDPVRAEEYRRSALSYLHRWQDRGGRIGNVSGMKPV